MASRKEKKVVEKTGETSEVEPVKMDRFEKFLVDLQADLGRRIEQSQGELSSKLIQNQSSLEEKLIQNQSSLEEKLIQNQSSLENKLVQSQQELKISIEGRLQEGAEKCESNINLLKAELKETESRLERQITGCRDSLEVKLAEEIKNSTEQLENKLSNSMQENVNKLGAKINEVRQDLETARNELRAEAELNVGSLRKEIEELQAKMSSLFTDTECKNKEWKENVEIQLKTDSQNAVEGIRLELGNDLEQFKKQQTNVISACEQTMKAIEKGVSVGLSANRDEMQDVRLDCRNRLEKGLDEIRENINALSVHMQSHVTGTEEKLKEVQKNLENEKINYSNLASVMNHLQAEKLKSRNMHDYPSGNTQPNFVDNVVECMSNNDFSNFDKVDGNSEECRNNLELEMTPQGLNDISPPTFDELVGDNPKVFIRELEEYFRVKRIPNSLKVMVAKKCLKKTALDWVRLTHASHEDYSTFKNLFIGRFWGKSQQNKVRVELATGKYESKSGLSMTEYFLKLANKNKLINPQMSELEIISIITRHYPMHIRNHFVVAKPITFSETIDLLSELEVNLRTEKPSFEPEKNTPLGEQVARREVATKTNGQNQRQANNNSHSDRRSNVSSEGGERNNSTNPQANNFSRFQRPGNTAVNTISGPVRNRYSNPIPSSYNMDRHVTRPYSRANYAYRPNYYPNNYRTDRGYQSQVNHLRFMRGYRTVNRERYCPEPNYRRESNSTPAPRPENEVVSRETSGNSNNDARNASISECQGCHNHSQRNENVNRNTQTQEPGN